MSTVQQQFLVPSDEYTPIPFWFWNDHLTQEEIVRQIRDFRDKGVMGFVIHPRIGIPETIPYLSDVFMDLVESAVEEANRLGMTVILYDEAMYPSGSAKGLVVKDNPEFASRGLRMSEYSCAGTTEVTVQLAEGENLVSAQAVQKRTEQQIDGSQTQLLAAAEGVVHFTPPNDKDWSIVLFIETYSKGTIRGIHFGEDDGEPDAPPSADLLNPHAVQKFIEITHETYYRKLGKYFGNTIQAIFTDEPDILGRRHKKGLKPWTRNFKAWYVSEGSSEVHLPVLWFDAGEETEGIRKQYRKTVHKRLTLSYYKALHDWCEQHQIALTGHPGASDDIGLLDYFQIPGQDLVWRWVAPEDGKALEGVHSTLGKCSSDGARHRGRRRNLNEFLGVCSKGNGWALTADDMKWYMDWLLVRGVNLLSPHAFYYSIDGERRINERPPDVGPNNIWWPHYKSFADYMKRMSWLMTDSSNVTPVAVLCEGDRLPWQIVKPLYQQQIEFNYLEEQLLLTACRVGEGKIQIGSQTYSVVLVENWQRLEQDIRELLQQFMRDGGSVIVYDAGHAEGHGRHEGTERSQSATLPSHLDHQPSDSDGQRSPDVCVISALEDVVAAIERYAARDVILQPASPDIRVSHVVKEGLHYYVLVNEGEQGYEGRLKLSVAGKVERWNAWHGSINDQNLIADSEETTIPLQLNRRESIIFCLDPAREAIHSSPSKLQPVVERIALSAGWQIKGGPSESESDIQLGSWTAWSGWEHFSGTIVYENNFELNDLDRLHSLQLDLGQAHEIVQVRVNDTLIGTKMWHPYIFQLDKEVLNSTNKLQIVVTNSLANRIDRVSLPSGLLGPVSLEINKSS